MKIRGLELDKLLMTGMHIYTGKKSSFHLTSYEYIAKQKCRRGTSEFNSLCQSDVIWRHNSGSISIKVMVCGLTARRYYLTHCRLSFLRIVGIHLGCIEKRVPKLVFEDSALTITATYTSGQWVDRSIGTCLGARLFGVLFLANYRSQVTHASKSVW